MTRAANRPVASGCARLLLAAAVVLSPSCATTGAEGQGDLALPTDGVGPFRKLGDSEVPGIAPFVFDDRTTSYREPAVLGGDTGGSAILYAIGLHGGVDVIVRTRADDARAFYGTTGDTGKPPVVLAADAPWEGKSVSGPFALRRNGEVLLYYAAAGGIGVARGEDGLTFSKEPGPILARDPGSSWETTELRAPSVYILPDGRLRMMYASGVFIGEAESDDGVHFHRVDAEPSTPAVDPVLGPAPMPAPGSLLPNERPPFDTAGVGDPCASVRITPAGRLQIRVLYTGTVASGVSTIGFAARFGETGPLQRQTVPIYSVGANEAAPALLEVPGGSYLYVHQNRRINASLTYPAIAAAFAPGTVTLPMPAAYPSSP